MFYKLNIIAFFSFCDLMLGSFAYVCHVNDEG